VPEDFIHRVGRTGRAGARGTATTFATRSERGEIARIERTLAIRLTRREVLAEIPREHKHTAPVIVIPRATQQPQRWKKFGTATKTGRRRIARAV
jgi:ATP-dependent RNA helicase RhlE